MGRESERYLSAGLPEERTTLADGVDTRGAQLAIAVTTEAIRPQGVNGNQDD